MKYLGAIVLIIALSSCEKYVQCKDYNIYSFAFSYTDTVYDTAVDISVFAKGNGFSSPLATARDTVQYISSINKFAFGNKLSKYNFSNYDWMIVLHPSEKHYRISELSFSQREEKGNDNEFRCANTLTFNLNGSNQTVTLENLSVSTGAEYIGYLPVTY